MHCKMLAALLSLLVQHVVAETVHGVVIFTRHGDRTTKHYGKQALTSLGAQQNFQVGSDYRTRYLVTASPQRILDVSEFEYVPSQIYASAPDQGILLNTATAFLQGLYPPLAGITSETLANGSTSSAPLDGYQYVTVHGADANSPDAIWIKGDDGCPAVAAASASFEQSLEFQTRLAATKDYYRGFFDDVKAVYDYTSPDNMTYANAYDIFDLLNVARIHNATSPATAVSAADMEQLRTLADSAELGYNFNATQPTRSLHAQTFAGAVLAQLNQTVTSRGALKLSLLAGSYDTFLAFFGLANLTALSPDFTGLPAYASTMAFELFSAAATDSFPADPAALRVRFLFRNGTAGALTAFPLFGAGAGADSLAYADFVARMGARAITSAAQWCGACGSTVDFCAASAGKAPPETPGGGPPGVAGPGAPGMSNGTAGLIGALVAVAVMGIISGLVFWYLDKRRAGRVRNVVAEVGDKNLSPIRNGNTATAL